MINIPLLKIPGNLQSIALGQLGADIFNALESGSGDWAIITALDDSEFFALTGVISAGGGVYTAGGTEMSGVGVLKGGSSLYGRFSAIDLSAGKVICYRAKAV